MRILYITTKSSYGGVQTHIAQCASFMKNNGNEVFVMAHSGGGKGMEREVKDFGINFVPNDFLKNSINPFLWIMTIIKIRKTVKKNKPDLVSCHSTIAGFLGRIAILKSVPVVFTAHGWGFTVGVNPLRAFFVKMMEKIASPLCRKIICVSEYDKNLALKHKITGANKITVIHNGTDCDLIEKLPEYLPKIKLKKGDAIPIVLNNRLSSPKRPEYFLEAFSMLPIELREKAEIFIIGDGEKRPMLEEFIFSQGLSARVHFLGSMSLVKVLSLYKNLIILGNGGINVLISDYEGFPRSIIEAMSFGFATISSDVGGCSEATDEETGILIKRGKNILEIKNALISLLENKDKIKELGANAKRKVFQEFNLNEMLFETKKIYDSLVGENNLNSPE